VHHLKVVAAAQNRDVLADDVAVASTGVVRDLERAVRRVDPVRLVVVTAQRLRCLLRQVGDELVEMRPQTGRLPWLGRFGRRVQTQESDRDVDADGEDKQSGEDEEAATEATTDQEVGRDEHHSTLDDRPNFAAAFSPSSSCTAVTTHRCDLGV